MLQNALFTMLIILDKLKPNSQLGGELTEPIGTNKTRNLTMTKAHFPKNHLNFHVIDFDRDTVFSLSYRVIFLQPETPFLHFYEDFWWHRIELLINI